MISCKVFCEKKNKKNAVFSSCWFVQFVLHVKLTEQYSGWEIVFTRSLTLVKNKQWNALFISGFFLWNLSGIIHLVFTQKFSQKLTFLKPWYAYQEVRNVSFSENFAYVINEWFLKIYEINNYRTFNVTVECI